MSSFQGGSLFRGVPLHSGLIFPPGGSVVSAGASMASLGGVAGLLGLEEVELQRSLTSRVMTTTKGGAVGTIIK